MCRCYTNPDGTVIVCNPCAAHMMSVLMSLFPEQEKARVESPTLLTATEHRGMLSVVNGWVDLLQLEEGVQA